MVTKGSGWHGEPRRHAEAVKKGLKTRYGRPTTTTKRKLKQVVNKIPKGWKKIYADMWQSPNKRQIVHISLTPFQKYLGQWQVYYVNDGETKLREAYTKPFNSKAEAKRKAIQFMKQLNDIANVSKKQV